MRYSASHTCHDKDLYLAGHIVGPGIYQRLSDRHTVVLEEFDYLPASLDGRVACYLRITPPNRDDATIDETTGERLSRVADDGNTTECLFVPSKADEYTRRRT